MAVFTATPKPAMPATFSVPARRPSSCPPPFNTGSRPRKPLRHDQRADAFGAADLVRRKGRKVRAYRVNIERNFAERLDRVDMQ